MGRQPTGHPTELELEILKVIWRDGPSTVRHVCDALGPARGAQFTSIHTIMKIMLQKGYVRVKKRPRKMGGNLYEAQVAQDRTASRMLAKLGERLFGGSIAQAIQHLIAVGEMKPKEIEELRRVLDKRKDQ